MSGRERRKEARKQQRHERKAAQKAARRHDRKGSQMRGGKKWLVLVSLVVLVLVCAFAAWSLWLREAGGGKIKHVVLISIDTCRADYLSCYGYPNLTTPYIDKFSREATLFTYAIAPVPMTLPSHATMLTGLLPPAHGVRDNSNYQLGASALTLPEVLAAEGFTTGAIVSSMVLDSTRGLEQGFTTYDDRFKTPLRVQDGLERRGDETTFEALSWLEQHQFDDRFFLFVHYYDPHYPYVPPEPYASRFKNSGYAGEVAFVDEGVGYIVSRLKAMDLYDSTLVIVTSDHGEMLGEHGELDHTYFVYQSAVRVPLICRAPGQTEARKVDELVGIVDIVPTVCGMLGIESPADIRGVDQSPLLRGKSSPVSDRHVYCESLRPTRYQANPLFALVGERWKYIRTTRPELYDLQADPGETNDLSADEERTVFEMDGHLEAILQESTARKLDDAHTSLDARTREQLASLGYTGGSVSEQTEMDPEKYDPKDLIVAHSAIEEVYRQIFRNELEAARVACQDVIARYKGLYGANLCMAEIMMKLKKPHMAVHYYDKAIDLGATEAVAYYDRGNANLALERYAEALADFGEAIKIDPNYVPAYVNRGTLEHRRGNFDEALKNFDIAVLLDPEFANAYCNRGATRVQKGNVSGARADYDKAIALNPRYALAYYRRAQLREAMNDPVGAQEDYAKVEELRPKQGG